MPLPIAVVVPHLPSREWFFEGFCMPSINANDPGAVMVLEGKESVQEKRNKGVKGATNMGTEFVFFCDDDVVLRSDCLDKLYRKLLDNPKAGYAYSDYLGIPIPPGVSPLGGVFHQKSQPFDPVTLRKNNYISTMSLVRLSAFQKTSGFDPAIKRFQDWDLWLTMAEQGIVGVQVPETLFHAYYLDQGISTTVPMEEALQVVRKKHGISA